MDTATLNPATELVELIGTVRVRTDLGVGALPAEATPVAGLVITPAVHGRTRRFSGDWTITHALSGNHLVTDRLPLAYAREAAGLLGETGIDWTRPADELHATRAPSQANYRVYEAYELARQEHRPIRWARASLRSHPPGYQLWRTSDHPGGLTDTDDWRCSWSCVLDFADTHLSDPATEDARELLATGFVAPDLDGRPRYGLACGAPACDAELRVPHSDQPVTVDANDRDYLHAEAYDRGWTRPGDRMWWNPCAPTNWLCPDCTRAYA